MLWILASLFFGWLTYRELIGSKLPRRGFQQPQPVYKPYLISSVILMLLCAWPPFKLWRFERFLSVKASQLADNRPAKVHCNTITDTMLDSQSLASGHANIETGEIVFQHGWCEKLMDYLADPDHASPTDFFSVHMFSHESMHVRGEYNEAKTECQAIQRDFRVARMLGVPDALAQQHALAFYSNSYQQRQNQGGFSAQYFSDQCAPGKALDEQLTDSTWGPLYAGEGD